ncbi:ferrous iron transport protein A [Candidatus Poribacteria bacterium]
MRIALTDMKPGQSGVLVEILGGSGMIRRLDALGLRLCKQVRKVSSMLMRGPVVIEVDGFQVAIGYGMASRIMVEIKEE